jgi:hypothetical protein
LTRPTAASRSRSRSSEATTIEETEPGREGLRFRPVQIGTEALKQATREKKQQYVDKQIRTRDDAEKKRRDQKHRREQLAANAQLEAERVQRRTWDRIRKEEEMIVEAEEKKKNRRQRLERLEKDGQGGRLGPPGTTPHPLGEEEFDREVGRDARTVAYDVEDVVRAREEEERREQERLDIAAGRFGARSKKPRK